MELATEGQAGVRVPPAGEAATWTAERRALTVGLLLSVTAVGFEAMAVATVLPSVADDLGGLRLYGWAFSAFMLANLISTVLAGQVADRRGPALPYACGLIVFGAGLVISGLAPSMLVLVLGRAVQGLGAGAIGAMAYVSLGRGYPDALRARVMALLSSAWVLPALIGPAVAGVVAERLTWRLVFLGLLPFLCVAAALMLPALRRMTAPGSAEAGPNRSRLAVLLALGVGVALAGAGLDQVLPAAVLIGGGIAVALPALRRLMPPGTLTARPGLPASLITRGLLTFTFFGFEAFLPLGLTELRGQSLAQAGLALTAAALGWTAGSWIQARLDGRDGGRGRRGRVLAGLALLLAGGVATAVTVLGDGIPVAVAAAAWGVGSLGMGVAYASLSLLALAEAPSGQEGMVGSSLQVAEVLSVAVGAGIGGAVVALAATTGRSDAAGISAAMALTLVGGVIGLGTARNLRAVR